MNLVDAIKSGKRFKRREEDTWKDQMKDGSVSFFRAEDGFAYFPTVEGILADDWEVEEEEEERVALTWKQVMKACDVARWHEQYSDGFFVISAGAKENDWANLKKSLGFKD